MNYKSLVDAYTIVGNDLDARGLFKVADKTDSILKRISMRQVAEDQGALSQSVHTALKNGDLQGAANNLLTYVSQPRTQNENGFLHLGAGTNAHQWATEELDQIQKALTAQGTSQNPGIATRQQATQTILNQISSRLAADPSENMANAGAYSAAPPAASPPTAGTYPPATSPTVPARSLSIKPAPVTNASPHSAASQQAAAAGQMQMTNDEQVWAEQYLKWARAQGNTAVLDRIYQHASENQSPQFTNKLMSYLKSQGVNN